ncbi:helix-turn-helix domain-containing protein [Leadbettera azotonutricia]|uniref:Conserved domain protein n=1 Tax=Leadbettera azotonutricia (strain ATCC BAA-888 / DSM 13862 / ZAS-9) TaxID=545695 RepID=F5YD01_LEAAZ|nr:helix-turn-helix transcriptional regulator [Leadbettera azotonutricia]AEF80442.1 conserved domain protein [Leadbettera azotonutricia ZAS-9]
MGISYRPLWVQLAQKGMKKTDLYTIADISTMTLAKMSKNQPVDGKILERLCSALNCQPGEIIEYIPDGGK